MKEAEIRPAHIFDEYLEIARRDIEKYFSESGKKCQCPACDAEGVDAFTKHGFTYQECPACQTLFVSPRPCSQAFSRYYEESESSKYWATKFYKETAEARREKLWKPKARMIQEIVEKYDRKDAEIIDIGGGYGIFAEEYEKLTDSRVTIIEPGLAFADICQQKGLSVINKFLEDLDPDDISTGHKVFVSFELFEHLHDPARFLQQLYKLMSPGDLFIFTTLSGMGIDIRALWEDSKSVSPPHHLNFLNPKSTGILLERTGFKLLQATTPGKLDIDILVNNRDKIKDRFWRAFIMQADDIQKKNMQEFISTNGWSSHMLIVSQKP